MNSHEQLVKDTVGNVYTVGVVSGGVRLNRYDGVTGIISEDIVVAASGQFPTISYDDFGNRLYLVYSVPGVEFRLLKFDPLSLSTPIWNTSYPFSSPINGFRPKVITPWTTNKSSDPRGVQIVYVEQGNFISILKFDPNTGVIVNKFDSGFTTVDPDSLSVLSSQNTIYVAHRKSSNSIEVLKYNAINYARSWFTSITNPDTLNPSNILMVEDTLKKDVYISYKNRESPVDFRVSKIISTGTVDWSSPTALAITPGIGNVVHRLYLFEGVPMLSFVASSNIVFAKISETSGELTTPVRSTPLPGFLSPSVSGYPAVLSEFPWSTLYVSYIDASLGTLQFRRFTTPQVIDITESVSELTQYQVCEDDTLQNSYAISRDSSGQIRIRGTRNNNTLTFDSVVSATGQTPAIACRGNILYYVFTKMISTFSEYLEITIVRASALTVTIPTWTVSKIIPVTSSTGIRPRIISSGTRMYVVYGRTNGYIYTDVYNNNNGVSVNNARLEIQSSNISEVGLSVTEGGLSMVVATPSIIGSGRVTVSSVRLSNLSLRFSVDTDLGDATSQKMELYVRQSVTGSPGNIYVVGKTLTGDYRVGYINSGGTGSDWNVDTMITNVFGGRLAGCYSFQDYLLMFYYNSLNTSELVCRKVASNGSLTSRTRNLPTPAPSITDRFFISSQDTFSRFFVTLKNNTTGNVNVYYDEIVLQTGLPPSGELGKYQHTEDSDGNQYIVYYDQATPGTKLRKLTPGGTLVSEISINTSGGSNPAILVFDGFLYCVLCTSRISLTDYITLTLSKYGRNSLTVVWTALQTFPDTSLSSFFPRLTRFSDKIHVIFVRNNESVYSSTYLDTNGRLSPLTPYNTGLVTPTTLEKREVMIATTSSSLYIGFPIDTDNTIRVSKLDPIIYTSTWDVAIPTHGGDARGLLMEEDTIFQSLIVAYTSTDDTLHRVSRIQSDGTVQVGFSGVNSTMSGLVSDRISSMYVFDEFVLLFGVKSGSGDIETIKLVVETGQVITPTTSRSVGLVLNNVLGTPYLLSKDPWSSAVSSYLNSITLLPTVQVLTVPDAISVTITTTEVSQYQTAIDQFDNVYPIYYGGSTEGVAMTKFDINGDLRLQRRFDLNGQTPAICIDPDNTNYLYVVYTKIVSAFTNYLAISLRKIDAVTLADVWVFNKLYTDTTAATFRPRIQVTQTSVYLLYVNNASQIVIQENNRSTGQLVSLTSPVGLLATDVDPTEISVTAISDALFICLPKGPLKEVLRFVRFNTVSKSIAWDNAFFESSVSGLKTAIVIRHSEIYGTYISYSSGGILRVAMVDGSTGSLFWSVALTSLTGIYGGRAHAFYLLNGLPLVFAIEDSTANLKVVKLNSDGTLISTRTKHLETFDTDLFTSHPALFSRENWDSIWLVFPDPTGPLYENWAILVNKLVSREIPDPSTNEVVLSENQFVLDTDDNMYVAYIKEYRPDISTLPPSIPDNWLNEYGTITLVNANAPTPRVYLVDSDGLVVYVEISPEVSTYGSSFIRFDVTLTNTTTGTTMTDIRIEDEVLPSGFVVHKFPTVSSLGPGTTITTSMDVNFLESTFIEIPFNVKSTFLTPDIVSKIFPATLSNPRVDDIKVSFRYSREISIYGVDFTKIDFTIQNRSPYITLQNVYLSDVSLPSGMVFNTFPVISSLAPLETIITSIHVDFNGTMMIPVLFTLRSSSVFTNPSSSALVTQNKVYDLSIVAPSNDLYYGTNGPNVVSLTRISGDGVVRVNADVDVGGESPAIFVDGNGEVYSAYSKRLVTFTEFMSITVQKTNSDLEPVWVVTRRYTDSFVDYFKPRIQKTSKGVHLVYFRQDGFLYIETFNPDTGELIGAPFKTTIVAGTVNNTAQLATYSTTGYLYIALPQTGSGNISVRKFDTQTMNISWTTTFNGGTPANPKTGIVIRCSENDLYEAPENLFVGYLDNAADIKISMIYSLSGTVAWTSSCGIPLTDIYGPRIHSLVVFGGYPSVFLVRNRTTHVSCTGVKFDDVGTIIEVKDVSLPSAIEPSFINGYPIVLTRSPWDVIFMEFHTIADLEYIEFEGPTSRLAVIAVDSPFDYTITVPESELSEYQMGSLAVGNTFLVYNDQVLGGVRLVKTNSSSASVLSDTVVDENGQSPALFVRDDFVYVSYIRYQSAFIGSIVVVRKKYLATTTPPTLLLTEETDYPDSLATSFRPRLAASDEKLYTSYVRQDGLVYLESIDPITMEMDFVVRTGFVVSSIDPLKIATFAGPDNFNIAFPNDPLLNQIVITRYNQELEQVWNTTTVETGVSNTMIREDFGTFLVYNRAGETFYTKYDSETGSPVWTYDFGLSSGFVGGRNHSAYALFGYPLFFNIDALTGGVRATKLSDEGALVSQRSSPLPGLVTSNIQNYPVVISRSPWNVLTLGFYTNTGIGAITVSPTKSIAILNFSATLINPTPLPSLEISDNQVDVYEDYAYYVNTVDTIGLLVTKHLRSTGTTVSTYEIPIVPGIPFSPCLRYVPSSNRLVVSYCTFTVGYTEIVEMFMIVLNASDLTVVASASRGLPDPSPDTFRPRIALSGDGSSIHRVYERYVRNLSIERFDLGTYEITDPVDTGISYLGGDVLDISLARGKTAADDVYLVYPLASNPTLVNVRGYRFIVSDYVQTWETTTDLGYPAEIKKFTISRVSNEVYISCTSGGSRLLLERFDIEDGTKDWSTVVLTIPGSQRLSHGFDIFRGFPMLYTVNSLTDQLVVSKFSPENGVQVSARTTNLTGFDYSTDVLSPSPVVVSYYPWDYVLVAHKTNTSALYYRPLRNVSTRSYSSPVTYVLPPHSSDVRTSQGVYQESGASQVVSYTSPGGASLYLFDGSVISNTVAVSSNGYRPSITKTVSDEDFAFVAHMESFNTFTEVHTLGLARYNLSGARTWTILGNEDLIFPDGSLDNFRPLVKTYANRLFLVYVREDHYLVIEERNKTSGTLVGRYVTTHYVPNPSEMVVGGDYDLCIGYTNGGAEIKLIKYEIGTPGSFVQSWEANHTNANTLEKRSLELVQNISEHVLVTYLGYNSATGLQDAFVFRVDSLTGNIIWSLPITTGLQPLLRLSGINYEGSFVNTSRVSKSTPTGPIEVNTFAVNAVGSTTRVYNGLLPEGTPLYVGNPLVMFNQGEGWVIFAYRDGPGTFRIIRAVVSPGSVRVDYDGIGNAITPGYEYWWRPRIFINPSIRGSNVEESTISEVEKKLNGVYRKWYPSGHLEVERFYNEGELFSYEQKFSKNGQWESHVTDYLGNAILRQFALPSRADLLAIFNNFDSNEDGFLTEAELLAGLNTYNLTIPVEQFAHLVQRMDKDESGNIDYREFVNVIPFSDYTRDITTTIGFDHAIKTLECQITNGKRNGVCTEYFDALPANRVRVTSNFVNDTLNGPYTEYHSNGNVKVQTLYTSGKRTGTYQEFYSNGNPKQVIYYGPQGRETGERILYDETGAFETYRSTLINDPSKPTILLEVVNRWSASVIKNVYYLDYRKKVGGGMSTNLRVGPYLENYESGVVRVSGGVYVRGLKNGLWTTFYETPNAKHIEENYVKDRLSGIGARKVYSKTGVLIESVDYPVYT